MTNNKKEKKKNEYSKHSKHDNSCCFRHRSIDMLDNQYFHIQRNQKQNIRYTRSRPFDASRNMLVKHRNAVDYTCSSSCGLTLQSKNVKSTKMLIKVVNELIIRHKLSGKCSFQRSICYKKRKCCYEKNIF